MKMVAISGIDKSGKSTIAKMLNRATCYRHFVIERDPTAVLTFAQEEGYARLCDVDKKEYIQSYEALLFNYRSVPLIAVFLYAPPRVIERRFKQHREPPLINGASIKEHQIKLMTAWKEAHWRYPVAINTHMTSPQETVELIIQKIKEV